MGLTGKAFKLALAIICFSAAALTFLIGEERGALEAGALKTERPLSLLRAHQSRTDLIGKVQEDAAGIYADLIQQLLRRAPLDPLPFEVGLSRALLLGDEASAERFADLALQRQPRSAAARLYRLSVSASAGQYDQVLQDYERLRNLRIVDQAVLTEALVGVFAASAEWSALLDYIRNSPSNGRSLLARLMREPVPPADLEPVLGVYPDFQSGYLSRRVREGAYEDAYRAWQTFTGLSDTARSSGVFNASFEPRSEPTPFNWYINKDRAEFQARGGLYVTYLGTGQPLLARQVLTVRPGQYALKTQLQGRMPEAGGHLEWHVTCLPTGQTLARSKLALKTISALETVETTLTIPNTDCAFQRLDLWGRPGAFPRTSRTEILSVRVEPAEA